MTNDTIQKTPETASPAATPAKVKKSKLEIAREKAAQANALLQKLETREKLKNAENRSATDTRIKILLGAYTQDRMSKSESLKAQVLTGLDEYLTRPADRALFELAPKPAPTPAPATPKI